jgi:hypothetical protein
MGMCIFLAPNYSANATLFSELLWAVYGFIQALENTADKSYRELAQKWQTWMDYTKTTAAKVDRPFFCLCFEQLN